MKKVIFFLILMFAFSAIVSAQTTQLQQAINEIAKRDVIIADVKAERNSLILQLGALNAKIDANNRGIDKAKNLLQKGYNDGKLNYKELWDVGFRIDIDSTNVYQRPDKKDKKK